MYIYNVTIAVDFRREIIGQIQSLNQLIHHQVGNLSL